MATMVSRPLLIAGGAMSGVGILAAGYPLVFPSLSVDVGWVGDIVLFVGGAAVLGLGIVSTMLGVVALLGERAMR